MTTIYGAIKSFHFITTKYCKNCGTAIKGSSCPKCGVLKRNEFRREYWLILLLQTFGKDVYCSCPENVADILLKRIGVSIGMDVRDQLKGLDVSSWGKEWRRIKKDVEQKAYDYYIKTGKAISLSGTMTDKAFRVKKLESAFERPEAETRKFIEGSQEELLSITRGVLQGYQERLNIYGEIPVLFYTKSIDDVQIEIGVRAPFGIRNKAYHVYMLANGNLKCPAKPRLVGGRAHKQSWVYAVNHSKRWKENLAKKLKHVLSLESRAVETTKGQEK